MVCLLLLHPHLVEEMEAEMSQRRIKKALMSWEGLRGKIGKYRIKLIPGRQRVTFLGVPIEGIKKNFKCYEK